MKKTLAILVALALVLSATAMASSDTWLTPEPVTLTFMGSKAPIQGEWADMAFFKYMEERTNVHIEFITVPSDSYSEKKNLAFASGDLPDVFFGAGLSTADEIAYGEQGLLIPLNDLLAEHATNFMACAAEYPNLIPSITTMDGNIYALPNYNTSPRSQQSMFWYNYEWLNALGVTRDALPTTVDELYDLLVRFRDEDPNGNGEADELPMNLTSANLREVYMFAFGAPMSSEGFFAAEDGSVTYQLMSDTYRIYLDYCHMLYDEKLLDNDALTKSGSQRTADSQSNLVGLTVNSLPANAYSTTSEGSQNYPAMAPLTSQYSDKPMKRRNNSITRGCYAITDVCQYPEIAIEWVDFMYSPYGSMTIYQGLEGEHWQYIEDGKWQQLTPEGWNPEEFRAQNTPDCGTTTPKLQFPEIIAGKTSVAEVYADNEGRALLDYGVICYPVVYFTTEETELINSVGSDVTTYVDEMEAQFITGKTELTDEAWSEYLNTLQKMGVEDYIAVYQDAYTRYLANK